LDVHIPHNFNNYFEPFLGGAAFFYHLIKKSKYNSTGFFLSDTNEELINVYTVIKNDIDALITSLSNHQMKYYENQEYFFILRNSMSKDNVERASRFIALNKTCFNGLYRVNKKGQFNVPKGTFKKLPLICDEYKLRNINLLFKQVNPVIEYKDYKIALSNAKKDDFVYLDPPYMPVSDTANFTKYTNKGFSEQDQINLSKTVKELSRRECKVLLSNSDTEFIRKLYSDFKINEVKANRAINSKASKRKGHSELIISNY